MATASWATFGDSGHARGGLLPPSRLMWLAEYRSLWELGFSLSVTPLLLTAPRGDGHPVLVLPGFLASDASTKLLRTYLRVLGYDAQAWELGRNWGGILRMRSALRERVASIFERSGKALTIVGWSLGGIYARDLAVAMPEQVRAVITLGSPFSRDPRASNVSEVYERVTGEGLTPQEKLQGVLQPHEFDRLAYPLPMPSTSIYSKTDGIVDWRASLVHGDERTENVEVLGASHIGLGVNPAVLWAVADRLAQPAGAFRRFERRGPFALAYGALS